MLGFFLRFLNPFAAGQAAVQSSGAMIGDFFGSSSKRGRKTVFLMILLGLLVLVPHMRVKLAERRAHAEATRAEELKADVARAEISRREAEMAQQKEAEARVIEREEARRSQLKTDEYLEKYIAREATVTNRLKEITNALNARKAGDAVAGDSAVILRNLNKVGVESAGRGGAAPASAAAHPVPDPVGPAPEAPGDAGAERGGVGEPSDGGVRETASAVGTQQ